MVLIGNENVRNIVFKNIGSTFLFVGPEHIGKATHAISYANEICGNVRNFYHIAPENGSIGVDSVRSMLERINLPPVKTGQDKAFHCVVIESVNLLNDVSANALLKSIEEPSFPTMFFMTATSKESVIDTIVSRSLIVRFKPIASEIVKSEFEDLELPVKQDVEKFILKSFGGKIGLVYSMQDDSSMIIRFERIARICNELEHISIKRIAQVVNLFDEKTVCDDLDIVAWNFVSQIEIVEVINKFKRYISCGCDMKACLDLMIVGINSIKRRDK